MKKTSVKATLKCLLATTLLTTLGGQISHAADPNNPPRFLKSQRTVNCTSDAWRLIIKEYQDLQSDGTLKDGPGTVTFMGVPRRRRVLRELPYEWAPDPNYPEPAPGMAHVPELQRFGPIVEDQSKPYAGRVCATDGSVIGFGQKYYILTENFRTDWRNTQITAVMGDVNNNTIELNAGELLWKYRPSLTHAAHVNAGPLPPTDFCKSAVLERDCVSPRRSGPDFGALDYENNLALMGRVSMVDLAMDNPGASGADIYHYMRGERWGTDMSDVRGMSGTWSRVLENLGIIDTQTIVRQMKGIATGLGVDRFIFRKIEPPKSSYDLLPVFDDEDDLQLIIRPRIKSQQGSWPTSGKVDQTQPRTYANPGGEPRPNPNYCAANDPYSENYIPQYMADQDVILELDTDLRFLTDAQMERIEDTGWQITQKQKEWTNEDYTNSIPETPDLQRPKYNCISKLAAQPGSLSSGQMQQRSATRSNMQKADGFKVLDNRAGQVCSIKDEAYYDALIERLIVINPALGSLKDHPCNRLRHIEGESVMADRPAEAAVKAKEVFELPARRFAPKE